MLVILDYGMGNLRSVEKAVQFLGHTCSVQPNLAGATKLIIPGVGAFGAAMTRIKPLKNEILAFASGGAPLLGICLGQQLLFESSEELGEHEGLGLIAGHVRYFPGGEANLSRLPHTQERRPNTLKVPHIGWNEAVFKPGSALGRGVSKGDQVYFVHSLYTECADPESVAATTEYGLPFASAVEMRNIWGAQFHPEKSSSVGLRILRNFLEC